MSFRSCSRVDWRKRTQIWSLFWILCTATSAWGLCHGTGATAVMLADVRSAGGPARLLAGRKGTTIWDDAAGPARAPNDNATASWCRKLISSYATEWMCEWVCVMRQEVRRGSGTGQPFESKVDFPLFPVFCFFVPACLATLLHHHTQFQSLPHCVCACMCVCVQKPKNPLEDEWRQTTWTCFASLNTIFGISSCFVLSGFL